MTTLTPFQALTAARELIVDPKNWTRNVYARTVDLRIVLPTHGTAVCFCSLGALYRVNQASPQRISDTGLFEMVPGRSTLVLAAEKLARSLDPNMVIDVHGPADVNDILGHEHAIKMYDMAIELAKADESQS